MIAMLNIKQIKAFVAVYEEGSFSRAAKRANATQSGLSMQNLHLEQQIGLKLFDRTPRGVTPTFAGHRLYQLSVGVLRRLDEASVEIKALASGVSGEIRVGLMPTFTRGVLAPALGDFIADFPNVKVSIMEAYSAVLTDRVAGGGLDFAIVPRAPAKEGLRTRLLGTDRELLVCRAGGPLAHLAPVRLTDRRGLKLILPARGNARRDAFDNFAELHNLDIASLLEMDAMIATLEFVANSDFVTILPETICYNDIKGVTRSLHLLIDPPLTVDYAIIEPAKAGLSRAAALFLERIKLSYRTLKDAWNDIHLAAGEAGATTYKNS
jgi:LysR family transcriptional regulator, nitrogen assimilation regulatory protein